MAYSFSWGGLTELSVVSFVLEQREGDMAMLSVTVKNPRVSLAGGGPGTLSGAIGFTGNLVGFPGDMISDSITLQFVADPGLNDEDLGEQKALIAEGLRVLPYFDPVFYPNEQRTNPDTALEARTQIWYVDRSGNVGLSDICLGGSTLVFTPAQVARESVTLRATGTPVASLSVEAEFSWREAAEGGFDITAAIIRAAQGAGTEEDGLIRTFTGEGLISDWPKLGTSLGSGWEWGESEAKRIVEATHVVSISVSTGGFKGNTGLDPATGGWYRHPQTVPNVVVVDDSGNPIPAGATISDDGNGNMVVTAPTETYDVSVMAGGIGYGLQSPKFDYWFPNQIKADPEHRGGPSLVGMPNWGIRPSASLRYNVERERRERITMQVTGGVQDLLSEQSDPSLDIKMQTAEVTNALDPTPNPTDNPNALVRPLPNVRMPSYLKTDRGLQSLQHLALLARSRMIARARCVEVQFAVPLALGAAITLDHSATLIDDRLPLGEATGKVVGYQMGWDPQSGVAQCVITLACTIGTTEMPLSEEDTYVPEVGTPDYSDGTYADPLAPYEASPGSTIALPTLDGGFSTLDDQNPADEADFFYNISEATAVRYLTCTNGQATQLSHMTGQADSAGIMDQLRVYPTFFTLQLRQIVTGEPIEREFEPMDVTVAIPRTLTI